MSRLSNTNVLKGSTNYSEEDWLALSGIQHFNFCRRQWALIHIEQAWEDNYQTTTGSLEHERAHDYSVSESRGETLILRDLRVFSRKMGITGACDVVEFQQDDAGIPLTGRSGLWKPFPVEYKHGKSKTIDADRLQLCAEAMCLEEMLCCDIPQGALFYVSTRHREIVDFDESLREAVRGAFIEMHQLYDRGHTPRSKLRRECNSCSLKNLCLPQLTKKPLVSEYITSMMKNEDK